MDQKPSASEESGPRGAANGERSMIYEVGPPGHYGACQQLVQDKSGADPDRYGGIWSNIVQGLNGTFREILATYWMAALRNIEEANHNYKEHQLPLARIKKVMKADPEVKMISAEAPILFAKGCDIFITELTMRAWVHADKRRTLQRSDIAAALSKSDMFDFLIDIVPREEAAPSNSKRSNNAHANAAQAVPPSMPAQQPIPPQQAHNPAPHEYYHMGGEHAYQQPPMYPPEAAPYGHPAAGLTFDHNPNMYAGYGMQTHQMYQNQPGPPQPIHGYRPHDGGQAGNDAEGEREYDGV